MPQGKHSRIQGKLVSTIEEFATDRPIALVFPELRCNFGGRSIVPDVAVLLVVHLKLTNMASDPKHSLKV